MRPIIAISMGDYNGIGPEVAIKSMHRIDKSSSIPIWIGLRGVYNHVLEQLGLDVPTRYIEHIDQAEKDCINVLDIDPTGSLIKGLRYGNVDESSGYASMIAIDRCIEFCTDKTCHAMVTAPISKEAVNKAGYSIPGHTEYLMASTKTNQVLMVLTHDTFKVALSTIHIPVKCVSSSISKAKLVEQLSLLNVSMSEDFGIDKPSIAVLGLNPHAGDGGIIGHEELDIIHPAIRQLLNSGLKVSGPFPADGYFASKQYENFDVTFAMYHDQGLIPFKMASFGSGVNFTAGLPIIRTSPDHGTAFDIAGQNIADERSFTEAYNLAVKMSLNRAKKSD